MRLGSSLPCLFTGLLLACAGSDRGTAPASVPPVAFQAVGHTGYGDWSAAFQVDAGPWRPGQPIQVKADLLVAESHLAAMAAAGLPVDALVTLVTAERSFDADGWMRLPSDERMSTLLTPTGIAIEGGIQGAATNRYGYPFKSPVDELKELAVATLPVEGTQRRAAFAFAPTLPADLPPGLYRLRFDFGRLNNALDSFVNPIAQ